MWTACARLSLTMINSVDKCFIFIVFPLRRAGVSLRPSFAPLFVKYSLTFTVPKSSMSWFNLNKDELIKQTIHVCLV